VIEAPGSLEALGPAVAHGRTAEVYSLGSDRVLKLLRPEFPRRLGEWEAHVAGLVAAAYPAAPQLFGTVDVEGRFGLVYQRIDGITMLERFRQRPWRVDALAATFAELHAAMHGSPGIGLPEQRAALRHQVERAAADLPSKAVTRALDRLEQLPTGEALCHGDLHPGNVLVGRSGAVIIDWENATAGNPAADMARALYLTRDAPLLGTPSRALNVAISWARRRFIARYLARYGQLRAIDAAEVAAWRLPILAARVAEGIALERPLLRELIDREVRGSA
jgi:aminoglycoside phosphotransferase (APT) family kinase protein